MLIFTQRYQSLGQQRQSPSVSFLQTYQSSMIHAKKALSQMEMILFVHGC